MSSATQKPAKAKPAARKKAPKKPTKNAAAAAAPKKPTAKKSTAPKKPTAAQSKSASEAAAPTAASTAQTAAAEPTVVQTARSVVLGPVMRKKELIAAVVTRTGIKKKDAKPVVEGMLAVLGEALAEGRELVLPPLGKVMVRKEKELANAKVMIVKVRQSKPPTILPGESTQESTE